MADTYTVETKESALLSKWEVAANRYEELNRQLGDESVLNQPALLHKLNKERTEMEDLARAYTEYQDVRKQEAEAGQMVSDPKIGSDLKDMAMEELRRLQERRRELERWAISRLEPKDPRDEKNTFLEIRAGTGGDEAALFAGDLFRMYAKYAEKKRLKMEVVEAHETGIGGYKDVVMVVEGKGAYGFFKHESGVHRVQRVPA